MSHNTHKEVGTPKINIYILKPTTSYIIGIHLKPQSSIVVHSVGYRLSNVGFEYMYLIICCFVWLILHVMGGGGGNHVASESKHPICTPRPTPRHAHHLGWALQRGKGLNWVGGTCIEVMVDVALVKPKGINIVIIWPPEMQWSCSPSHLKGVHQVA